MTKSGTVIHLLERLALARTPLHLTDKKDHGGSIVLGNVNTRRCVGGTRCTGHKTNPGLPGEFAMRLGHHGGTSLLAANGDFNRWCIV